jgi:hypothetical protein
VVRRVLEFLDEPWEPGILNYQAFPHSGGGDPKTPKHDGIRVNSDRYASWPAEHQQAIRGMLDDHLRRYGYSAAPS